MGKQLIILSAVCIILLLTTFTYISKNNSAESKLEIAQTLSGNTRILLRNMDIKCTSRDSDFEGINSCVIRALRINDFNEKDYKAFNTRTNESGYIIIENKGTKVYNGTDFEMLKNGIPIIKGCHISSTIEPKYTCRFSIEEECERGDVLEINYQGTRVHIKTC